MRTLAVLDDRFEPRPLPSDPFANSIGVHTRPAERVGIEIDADMAGYLASREWHRSQAFESRPDGSVMMRLDVSVDRPLRCWILGLGAGARVVAPARLAQEIFEEIDAARERYLPQLSFEMLRISGEPKPPRRPGRDIPRASWPRVRRADLRAVNPPIAPHSSAAS
jgi:hypothetical protein